MTDASALLNQLSKQVPNDIEGGKITLTKLKVCVVYFLYTFISFATKTKISTSKKLDHSSPIHLDMDA